MATLTTEDRLSLTSDLRMTLRRHGLNLEEVTWRENFTHSTLKVALKVNGDLHQQTEMFGEDGDDG